MRVWYKGYWCDSSWELAFIIYHLDHNISFKRNKQGFKYTFEEQTYQYYPDFIYEDGTYIEIKGRKKFEDLDKKNKAKINQFNKSLAVFFEKDMENIIYYCKKFYGRDFIKLYK